MPRTFLQSEPRAAPVFPPRRSRSVFPRPFSPPRAPSELRALKGQDSAAPGLAPGGVTRSAPPARLPQRRARTAGRRVQPDSRAGAAQRESACFPCTRPRGPGFEPRHLQSRAPVPWTRAAPCCFLLGFLVLANTRPRAFTSTPPCVDSASPGATPGGGQTTCSRSLPALGGGDVLPPAGGRRPRVSSSRGGCPRADLAAASPRSASGVALPPPLPCKDTCAYSGPTARCPFQDP